MPPKGGRKKKALLIGINYTGSRAELNGCHADVENVGRFLNNHGYPAGPRCRLVLRDDLEGKYYPTGVSTETSTLCELTNMHNEKYR